MIGNPRRRGSLVALKGRQIHPSLHVPDFGRSIRISKSSTVHRYGVVRNTLAIEVEAQIRFGQVANIRHTFDEDRLAARIGSKPYRRRVLAPAKLDALIFLQGIEPRLIQNGIRAQSDSGIRTPTAAL